MFVQVLFDPSDIQYQTMKQHKQLQAAAPGILGASSPVVEFTLSHILTHYYMSSINM